MAIEPYFHMKHFLKCYWGEDGPSEYGDVVSALRAYMRFEGDLYSKGLQLDIEKLSQARSFGDDHLILSKRVNELIYKAITSNDAEAMLAVLSEFRGNHR